jgi:class 3 adenylate cyclase
VRRLRFHDPDNVTLKKDLAVLYVTPSINQNDFHSWLRDSFSAECVIGPKETKVLEFDARRGWHDAMAPAVHGLTFLIGKDEGPSEVDLELFDGQMLPEQVDVRIGPVRLNIRNTLDAKMLVGVGFLGDDNDEHPMPNWRIEPFLTGKRLLTNQTFRNLFKADTIEVGTGMQVKSLTVLFTDLQASTAMYERVGDINALGIVRRHFDVLEGAVAKHHGAIVKTIGDAVMAVFADPAEGMAAAAEMIETVRQAVSHGEDLVLKIGIHQGACVAIQSNNQIDYFGRIVNIAARVQSLAEGGEIVCSEEIWQSPGVQDRIRGRGLTVTRESAALKGIGDRFPVRRIVVAHAAAPRSAAKRKPAAGGRKHPVKLARPAPAGKGARVKRSARAARPARAAARPTLRRRR